MSSQRLFLAVPLPADIKEAIAGVQDAVTSVFSARGRTHSDALHVTLRFFGSVPVAAVARLEAGITEALNGSQGFDSRLDRLMGFGSPENPRVVVITLTPGAPWGELAGRVERQARRMGWAPERRMFRPHITIHRPKRPGCVPQEPVPPLWFPVREVVLYESELRSDRAYYRAVCRWALSGQE